MSCKACAEIPVVPSDYQPQGAYDEIEGLQTYTRTHAAKPTSVVIAVYDVFGFHPSTLQGADILAQLLPNSIIIVPDFFKGDALPLDVVPPDTDEKKAKLGGFLGGPGNPAEQVPKLEAIGRAVKTKYSVDQVVAYGLCWGGLLTAKTSVQGSPFLAAGTAHPGRPDKATAEAIAIPYVALLSKEDGSEEDVQGYMDVLNARPGSFAEKYGSMHHGWAGARANLADEANVKEYQRAYAKFAEFFGEKLK